MGKNGQQYSTLSITLPPLDWEQAQKLVLRKCVALILLTYKKPLQHMYYHHINSKIKAPCKLKLPIMLDFLVFVLHHSKTIVEILQIK